MWACAFDLLIVVLLAWGFVCLFLAIVHSGQAPRRKS